METNFNIKNCGILDDDSICLNYTSMVHGKKIVKHALRQQVKRRRKNTTIAAGNSRSLPRIIHTLPSAISSELSSSGIGDEQNHTVIEDTAATMKEVLASLPGFSIKPSRRRSIKRLSIAAQLEAGLVDLESPASILSNTSLRALLNRHTFQGLPPLYQRKLAQLLPIVDRQDAANSGLNNEFFARACQEWRKRLAEGEFTPENQQRLKMEAEKDKNKLDPWKLKHFEPIWGDKRDIHRLKSGLHCMNKEQRCNKNILFSHSRSIIESNINPLLTECHSNTTLMKEKVRPNVPSLLRGISNDLQSVSTNDQRQLSKFSVTVQILEDDEEDDEEDEEDDDEDDEEDELEDDEDEDDCDEDEDDDDDDDLDSVSLTYVNEEAEHCRAIIVARANNEELYNKQQISDKIPVIEKSKYTKAMIVDFVNDSKYVDIEMNAQEEKHNIHKRNITRSLNNSTEELKFLNNYTIKKSPECIPIENVEILSENCINEHRNMQVYKDSSAKLKLSVKDESCSNDIIVNIKSIDKEKYFQSTDLCCQENSHNQSVIHSAAAEMSQVIEIDNETLQRIHELEVRGEIQEPYEEISGCSEEIIYPILEDIELDSTKVSESPSISDAIENPSLNCNVNARTQEEAFQEANNYVCSEMLDCSWTSNDTENTVSMEREDLQVPWPLVAAALDSAPTHIPMAPLNECDESKSKTDKKNCQHDDVLMNNVEQYLKPITCTSTSMALNTEDVRLTSPTTSCFVTNLHTTQSSSIITFPQLQSIRFVQTNFQTTIEQSSSESRSNAVCAQIQNSIEAIHPPQNNFCNSRLGTILPNNQNDYVRNENDVENETPILTQDTIAENSIHQQNTLTKSTVVLQQQSLLPLTSRQFITTLQPQVQPHYPMIMNVPTKMNRSNMQTPNRSSKNGSREQNNSRSRNFIKEPPGAVNLERSYQICQAVIASSPNREQLKAHLKPPPSFFTKSEKSFPTHKCSSRTSSKIQKNYQLNVGDTVIQNKSQGIVVKQIFTTARQTSNEEILEKHSVNQNTSSGEIGQYIVIKQASSTENSPRASSAPPMPPQIAGMSIGVHIVRGRPASADESSHQVVALKIKESEMHDNGGTVSDSSVNIEGDLPLPCKCNIQGAMIMCRKCGAFCHDNCINPQCICAVCLIR